MRFSFLSGEEKALRSAGLAFPFKHHKSTYQVSTQAPHHLLPSIRRQLSPVNLIGSLIDQALGCSSSRGVCRSRMQPTESFCRSVRSSLTAVASRSGVCLSIEPRKNLHCEAYLPPIKSQISLKQLTLCFPSLFSPSKLHSSPLFSLVGRGVPQQPQDHPASCWQKRGSEAPSCRSRT